MEKVYFSEVFLVALVLAMETDACDTMEGLGCTSMCDYTLKMLNKMTSIEIEIREAMRCLTEQVLSCSDTSDTAGPPSDPACPPSNPVHPPSNPDVCPEGWCENNKRCYYFGDDDLTWGEAMTTCKRFGGHLVEINSSGENQYLRGIAGTLGPTVELWLGGTDAFKEGEWRWINSMKRIAAGNFTDWLAGNPSGGNEHCLEMKAVYGLKWNDDECYHRQKYICEKEL